MSQSRNLSHLAYLGILWALALLVVACQSNVNFTGDTRFTGDAHRNGDAASRDLNWGAGGNTHPCPASHRDGRAGGYSRPPQRPHRR
ncbi:MAG: hypothetical protein AB1801_00870 [Chloroflexota bacterium]